MRLVVQRVSEARVSISGKVVGKIDKGFLVLVGVTEGDNEKMAQALAEKLVKLRIMSDGAGKMNLSVKDVGAGILAISQFTLHADTSKGNRPSFVKAAKPELAEEIYDYFVQKLKELGIKVETGEFGACMEIDAKLDGPVTILLDSKM